MPSTFSSVGASLSYSFCTLYSTGIAEIAEQSVTMPACMQLATFLQHAYTCVHTHTHTHTHTRTHTHMHILGPPGPAGPRFIDQNGRGGGGRLQGPLFPLGM